MSVVESAQIGQFELELELDATPERTWKALTEEIDQWWLPDFRAAGERSVVSLDLRAGGGLIERTPDGAELIWYTVQMVQPGSAIYLVGHTAPDWGGPCVSMLKLSLASRSGGTVLTISDSILGRVDPSKLETLSDGWKSLFGGGLRAHLSGPTA